MSTLSLYRVILVLLLVTLAVKASAADSIEFPAHVGYKSDRFQSPTRTTRLKVCPLPNTATAGQCLTPDGTDGWIDPNTTSPVPGFWLRHVMYAERAGVGMIAILFFCPDKALCPGDD